MEQLTTENELENMIRKFALHNALLHHGKADVKAVLGKLLADRQDLRSQAKQLVDKINPIVTEINSLPYPTRKLGRTMSNN